MQASCPSWCCDAIHAASGRACWRCSCLPAGQWAAWVTVACTCLPTAEHHCLLGTNNCLSSHNASLLLNIRQKFHYNKNDTGGVNHTSERLRSAGWLGRLTLRWHSETIISAHSRWRKEHRWLLRIGFALTAVIVITITAVEVRASFLSLTPSCR